jgi:hypothetical protein
MAWSANVRACKTLWTTLIALDQLSEATVFKKAGTKLMKDLTFFAGPASPAAVNVRARGLAFDLDRVFQTLRGARFESGVTQMKAIDALVAILKNGSKTVAELADEADAHYHFVGEKKA